MTYAIFRNIYKHKLIYTFSFIYIYLLSCAVQGFDLTDEGWGMYFFQQLFNNPECVESNMPFWVTGVLGWIWNSIFPHGGYLWLRFIGITMITGMSYMIYRFLRKSFDPDWILIGLIAQTIIIASDVRWFGYNSLSVFFLIASVIFMLKGLEKKNLWILFAAGFILGLNVFVRLSNLSFLSILILIPLYKYWNEKRFSLIDKNLWISVTGCVLGITFIILLLKIVGHWTYFIQSFGSVVDSASDQSNSHELGRMFEVYANNYMKIVINLLYTIISFVLYTSVLALIRNKYLKIALTALIVLYFAHLYNENTNLFRPTHVYFVNGVSFLGIFIALFNKFNDSRIKYITWASLITLLCIPLGSDQGVLTVAYTTYLSLPFALSYIAKILSRNRININSKYIVLNIPENIFKQTLIATMVVTIICGIYKTERYAFFDVGTRCEKIYAIDNKFTRGVFTNKYRAELINEVLSELKKYVKPDDYLLVYNFMPGLNYMTQTRSYTTNSWVWGMSGKALNHEFELAKLNNKPLPVVLRHYFRAANKWTDYDERYTKPELYAEDVLSRPDQTKAINDFIEKNNYKRVWTNLNFEILVPQSQN